MDIRTDSSAESLHNIPKSVWGTMNNLLLYSSFSQIWIFYIFVRILDSNFHYLLLTALHSTDEISNVLVPNIYSASKY